MSLNIVQHATCTFCGCVCDDIELHADDDKIVKTKHACSLGEAWFRNHTAERLYPDALDRRPAGHGRRRHRSRGRFPLHGTHAIGLWHEQYHLRSAAGGRIAGRAGRRRD